MPADAYHLLDKPFGDPAVEAVTGPGLKNCFVDGAGHIACQLLGFFFTLGEDDRIRQVTTYPNAVGAYRPYRGPLPFGLAPGDTRATVRAKLGMPQTVLTNTDIWTGRSPRVSITYFPEAAAKAGLINQLSVFYVR